VTVFAVLLILLGVAGLVVDDRSDLQAQGYGWVPGAAVACIVIGALLLLGRIGSNGGLGVVLVWCGAAGLLTERWWTWAPASLHELLSTACWALIALGVLVWVARMTFEHGPGGLSAALGLVTVVSLVADSATVLPSPWDATLDVLTAASAAGAVSAGLAGIGSIFEEEDLLGLAYAWLGSAVVACLGLSVTALAAARAFHEPPWAFALLVTLVAMGILGATAALFIGTRAIAWRRHEYDALDRMIAEQAVRERLGLDEPEEQDDPDRPYDQDEASFRLADEPPLDRVGRAATGRPRPASSTPRKRRDDRDSGGSDSAPRPTAREQGGLSAVKTWMSVTADCIAIATVVVAAIRMLG
jgi:hypothetical protein